VYLRDSPPVAMSPPRMGILSTALDTPSYLCASAHPVPALPHIPHRPVVVSEVVVLVPPRPLGSGTVPRVIYGTRDGSWNRSWEALVSTITYQWVLRSGTVRETDGAVSC
jgi:hypothetical protein